MTTIIKARSTDAFVRALPDAPERRGVPETTLSRVERELAAAHVEIADLRSTLAAATIEADAAIKRAREAGQSEGRAVADTKQDQRLAAIERGVAGARRAWDERLAGLDALAASLSRAALRKIFEPDADLADLTVRVIARQTARLSGETVVAIRVGAADFEAAALETLREASAVDVAVDARLASGECRFDLMLGGRDVGPLAQWAVLERFLGGLADGMADGAEA